MRPTRERRRSRVSLGLDLFLLAAFMVLCGAALWPTSGLSDLSQILAPSSAAHWLGTDNMGRDLLQRLGQAAYGAVLPLWGLVLVASAAGAGVGFAAVILGANRWTRGVVTALQAVSATLGGIPVGVAVFVVAAWLEGTGLVPIAAALCVLFALRNLQLVTELYRLDARLGYWQAHQAMGGRLADRLWRYGFCGAWKWALGDTLVFHLKAAVAIEAALSYLQFGVQEPQASFGNMLASHFELGLHGEWRILLLILAGLLVTAAAPSAVLACVGRSLRSET